MSTSSNTFDFSPKPGEIGKWQCGALQNQNEHLAATWMLGIANCEQVLAAREAAQRRPAARHLIHER
jgi:hypothetical protein